MKYSVIKKQHKDYICHIYYEQYVRMLIVFILQHWNLTAGQQVACFKLEASLTVSKPQTWQHRKKSERLYNVEKSVFSFISPTSRKLLNLFFHKSKFMVCYIFSLACIYSSWVSKSYLNCHVQFVEQEFKKKIKPNISQNHGELKNSCGWKAPLEVTWSNPSVHIGLPSYPGPCPDGFWVFPRMKTYHLCGQSVPVLGHSQNKKVFLMFKEYLLCFSLCPLPLVLSLNTTGKSLAMRFLLPPFKYLHTLMSSPSPSSLSLFS